MNDSVTITRNPLYVKLPESFDTNETYEIVAPDGVRYPLVYDFINSQWTVLPF